MLAYTQLRKVVLSDGIVAWRAWLIWGRRRWILIVSVILGILTLGVSSLKSKYSRYLLVGDLFIATFVLSLRINQGLDDGVLEAALWLPTLSSLVMNIWATSLVGYKSW